VAARWAFAATQAQNLLSTVEPGPTATVKGVVMARWG
jgi:hypothetical protein